MIHRALTKHLKSAAKKNPVIIITGPRQSGKTTLSQLAFPDYDYINLEHPPTRQQLAADPEYYLLNFRKGLIIDEAQHFPELFSYIQVFSDASGKNGRYVLTGSQNFILLDKISQSLAGRSALFYLLPFSVAELKNTKFELSNWEKYVVHGFYPRIFDRKLKPENFYSGYLTSYIERDVRSVLNVSDLNSFQVFLKLCAGRTGQMVNFSEMGMHASADHKTIKRWLSVLETSFVVYLLYPHHKNYNKRIVKTPKLYFYDTGLAAFLLGIRSSRDLQSHWARGFLFENFIISEIIKNYRNADKHMNFYFWRNNIGQEADLIIEKGTRLKAVEIKAGKTLQPGFYKGLEFLKKISGKSLQKCYLVYGGNHSMPKSKIPTLSWTDIEKI